MIPFPPSSSHTRPLDLAARFVAEIFSEPLESFTSLGQVMRSTAFPILTCLMSLERRISPESSLGIPVLPNTGIRWLLKLLRDVNGSVIQRRSVGL